MVDLIGPNWPQLAPIGLEWPILAQFAHIGRNLSKVDAIGLDPAWQ